MTFAYETEFFIHFTRRWWLDLGYGNPLFSPFMEFEDRFQHGLFDPTEAFVSPCTLNTTWCGGVKGSWTPTVQFMSGELPCE